MSKIDLSQTADSIKRTIDQLNKPLGFHQQPKNPQNMAVSHHYPSSGTLWIRPLAHGGYDVCLSGYELTKSLFDTFTSLFGPIAGYKAQFERMPFWKVQNFHDVRTAIITYASTIV